MVDFNRHEKVKGQHSFLSASKYHWLNYDDEKLERTFIKQLAAARGTRLHETAARCIQDGVKLAGRDTIARYVNDCIGFRMEPEVVLFYSFNSFGTADAIGFRKDPETGEHVLRIFDLKTGTSPTSMDQLKIYAALFCLEYKIKPSEITTILRIYQSRDVVEYVPDYDEIVWVMERIVWSDSVIEKLKAEVN